MNFIPGSAFRSVRTSYKLETIIKRFRSHGIGIECLLFLYSLILSRYKSRNFAVLVVRPLLRVIIIIAVSVRSFYTYFFSIRISATGHTDALRLVTPCHIKLGLLNAAILYSYVRVREKKTVSRARRQGRAPLSARARVLCMCIRHTFSVYIFIYVHYYYYYFLLLSAALVPNSSFPTALTFEPAGAAVVLPLCARHSVCIYFYYTRFGSENERETARGKYTEVRGEDRRRIFSNDRIKNNNNKGSNNNDNNK